jgi:hypothetical protein
MEKSPAERFPTMQDMLEHLEAARAALRFSPFGVPPRADETLYHTTMQIGSVDSLLQGPHFVVVAAGAILLIPPKNEVLIGRADPRGNVVPDIDLSLYGGGSAGVSRQHARLLRREAGWVIEDLRSTNGTYVNDRPVAAAEPQALSDGDNVRCGQLVLTFHTHEADPV